MTPAELVVVPRFILWIGAAITALLALSTRRRWPDRARALRKTAPVLTLWAFFFVGSLETALHFSHETALLWQGFVGVTAILASLFLCSWVDAPKMTWGWGVLWFVSLLGHLSLSMGAEDLNAITSEAGQQERTLQDFEADPTLAASRLTNAVCRADVKFFWSERHGGKNSGIRSYRAVPVIHPDWKKGSAVRTWVLDGHKTCPGEGSERPITRLVRDRRAPDALREVVGGKLHIPGDATLVRVPPREGALEDDIRLGSWGLCVTLLLSVGWWLIGTPLLATVASSTRRIHVQWLHDGVILDLGPVMSSRANLVRPLAYALVTGTVILVVGFVLMCLSGWVGEIAGWWILRTRTYSWVTFGVILPICSLIAALYVAWRQKGHLELHISTLAMRLVLRRHKEVWAIPIHEVAHCVWLLPPDDDLEITRTDGSTLRVHLPEPLEDGLDLGSIVSEAVASARSARGEAWEVPETLRELLQRSGSDPTDP